jgi:site-specific DNA recombinase
VTGTKPLQVHKGRIAELKRIRDAAQADAERAEGRGREKIEITPEALRVFAAAAKERMRHEDGSFRRMHPVRTADQAAWR